MKKMNKLKKINLTKVILLQFYQKKNLYMGNLTYLYGKICYSTDNLISNTDQSNKEYKIFEEKQEECTVNIKNKDIEDIVLDDKYKLLRLNTTEELKKIDEKFLKIHDKFIDNLKLKKMKQGYLGYET